MNHCVVFMLDEDKDFLKLYSALLRRKGCQVFATDNLFLLIKYASSARPSWIFIDEDCAAGHSAELIAALNQQLSLPDTHYTIMLKQKSCASLNLTPPAHSLYKTLALEKIMRIAENCCIMP